MAGCATQGYNLNCKKIKQFLISSIATALLFGAHIYLYFRDLGGSYSPNLFFIFFLVPFTHSILLE